jgi:uncharacterized protein YdeI (YjbR/CyaY-like superfamily)
VILASRKYFSIGFPAKIEGVPLAYLFLMIETLIITCFHEMSERAGCTRLRDQLSMKQLYVKTRAEWREWLRRHHDTSPGIWLVFYKKHTGKPSLPYDDAVEEAVCFGWIDSIIKKIDEEKYARKLTPRKPDSRWSELNRQRVKQLDRKGLMTMAGEKKVAEAKRSGHWEESNQPRIAPEIPEAFERALAKNKKARKFFDQLAPSYRKNFIGWVAAAKRRETRDRRIKESIALLARGEKLGMK